MSRHRTRAARQRIQRLGPKRASLAALRDRHPQAFRILAPRLNPDLTPKVEP